MVSGMVFRDLHSDSEYDVARCIPRHRTIYLGHADQMVDAQPVYNNPEPWPLTTQPKVAADEL